MSAEENPPFVKPRAAKGGSAARSPRRPFACQGPVKDQLESGPQSRVVRTASRDLIWWRAGACGRRVRLVQLNVTASQEAGRDNYSGGTSERGADACDLQPELIHPRATRVWIIVVLRPGPELDRAKKVGIRRAAEITHVRTSGWLKVGRNGTVHVQPGATHRINGVSCVMVYKVHVAEEPVVLASSHKAEVRVVAAVRDNEPPAGREVARAWNDMGSCYGSIPERKHGQK